MLIYVNYLENYVNLYGKIFFLEFKRENVD